MSASNANHCSALGRQAATLAWLQIPIQKRQALAEKIRQRQQKHQPQTNAEAAA